MSATVGGISALLWAWAVGVVVVSALWPREGRRAGERLLMLAVGAWMGMGLTSAYFCAASFVTDRPALMSFLLEVLTAALAIARSRHRTCSANVCASAGPSMEPLGTWLIGVLLVQSLVFAVVVATRTYHAQPYGGWDAWAIWNLHARFMFHGGPGWAELLRVPSIHWTHPDYPWLVPASIARVWAWAGSDAPWGAGMVSAAFTLLTVALLLGAVACARGALVALVAGLVLLGTPFFLTFHEHADIALGCGMLVAVAVLVFADQRCGRALWWLAGICAALPAWTKNEGLLFALVFVPLAAAIVCRRRSRAAAGLMIAGFAAAMLPVMAFRLIIAAPSDLLQAPLAPRLGGVLDPQRHATILAALWRDVRGFGEWQVLPFAAMLLATAAPGWRRLIGAERVIPAVLLLMLLGYYAVYLLTPHDLQGHLESSLVRLLLQLWPMAIFLWSLLIPHVDVKAPIASSRGRTGRVAIFIAVNAALALAVLFGLSRQLAPNELAAARIDGAEVRALLGEGWFGVERADDERWAWSEGTSAVLFRSSGSTSPRVVDLRFDLRGLGRRTVAVTLDDRVLWRGEVTEEFQAVEIPAVVLSGSETVVRFATDTPGVPEAPDARARKLTFALYNVKLK